MKQILSTLTAFAVLAGLTASAQAQNESAGAAALPVKIGLVDMARVFKEYDKFNEMRESLQQTLQGQMQDAQKVNDEAKKVREQLALLKPGTPQFIMLEQKLARLTSDVETKRKLAQANYVRSEADIFKKVYVEVTDVVKLYAEHFKYTMILRFNSEPLSADNPKKLATSLNKLVIHSRPSDDISGAVISYLNKQYAKNKGRIASPPAKAGTSRN